MASRLSSLLVRDGLVGVKRMEKAFQHQVIYGGTLDTILLEMNLIAEERLLQYLSLSTGVPPATRAETDVFDAEAVRVLPGDLARMHTVAPLSYDGETLRVVVKEPVDFGVLESLANELGKPIQPLVVPEYRFHVVFDRAYGKAADARYDALAQRAREETAPTPVGKPATVIVEVTDGKSSDRVDAQVVDVTLPPSATSAVPMPVAQRPSEPTAVSGQADVAPLPAPGEASAPDTERAERPPSQADGNVRTTLLGTAAPPRIATKPPHAITDQVAVVTPPADADAPGEAAAPSRVVSPSPSAMAAAAAMVPDPLSPQDAMAALAAADDRDGVFAALLRAVRGRAWYAGLLTVQGGVAIGRVAIVGREIDSHDIATVIIPLDTESPFRQAVMNGSPYIGPIATNDPEIDGMILRMGGVVPPAALLLPIELRNRTVALAVGHNGADTISIAEVAEVLPLASATADAISRLIIKAKKVGYRPAITDESAPHVNPDAVQTKAKTPAPTNGSSGEPWSAPPPETAQEHPADLPFGSEPLATEPATAIDALLDAIESDGDAGGLATAEVLRRAPEAVPAIDRRFPGELHVDRYTLGGRAIRAERHSSILGLVVKLGTAAAEILIDKMRDDDRDIRYYATLCTSELRPKSALRELVERLFDQDYGVRGVAIDALAGYPASELEAALEGARRALHSDDPTRVQAAASALGELADVRSIPDLLDTVSRSDASTPAVRGALKQLSKQDHGTSVRKWRAWWTKNRERSRIEWLLDGLTHKTSDIRQSAAEDLRRLTGQYFGFHHDLPKRDREVARKNWIQWWNETGRRRFLRDT